MKKLCYSFPILLLCVFGCVRQPKESEAKVEIAVDLNKSVEEFDLSTMLADASGHEIIRLETNGDCLIGSVERIFCREDKIFIYDEMAQNVYCFNDDGSYNCKIGSRGRANNEYIEIFDVYVSNSSVYIYDNVGLKILCYDLAGQYLKTIDISKYWAMSLFEKDDKLYLVNHWSNSKEGRYRIFVIDRDGNLLAKELPFEEQDDGYGFSGSRYALFSNSVDVNFGNVIYRLSDNNQFIPQYRIDFGDKTLPMSYYPFELSKAVSSGLHKKYIFGIEYMHESERYLLFNFYYTEEAYTAIYDKKDDKLTVADRISNKSLLDISIGKYFVESNNVYSYYPANDILMVNEYNWKNSSHADTEEYREMKAKIAGMTDMDNGLIIKYRLKSDEN